MLGIPEYMINAYKDSNFLNRANISMKVFMYKSGLISDDTRYKKHFDKAVVPEIHNKHLNDNFICCTFCNKLKKSVCHENCFKCSGNVYDECSPLIPGTFPFKDSHFDTSGSDTIPWIFKTPCTNFERLDLRKYFRNFNSQVQSITVANYEALEGIFTGISRNKRPCHICASVNLDIFNKCSKNDKITENKPCSRIIDEISAKYHSISGMIKYVE